MRHQYSSRPQDTLYGIASPGQTPQVPDLEDPYLKLCAQRMVRLMDGLVQVAWDSGQGAQSLWQAVQGLLEYPHNWVRKASARLLGLVLASPSIGERPPPPPPPPPPPSLLACKAFLSIPTSRSAKHQPGG